MDPVTDWRAQRGGRCIALHFLDLSARRRWMVSTTLRPLYLPGETRYPLYRTLGGPQGRSGRLRKISPLPGFDPRTVQPVGSCTDWAIPAQQSLYILSYPGPSWSINQQEKRTQGVHYRDFWHVMLKAERVASHESLRAWHWWWWWWLCYSLCNMAL
jgi:hypothetical protein